MEITEKMHTEFQDWYFHTFGYKPTSRSSEPGKTDHYEHPFQNGTWEAWLYFTRCDCGKPMSIGKCNVCDNDE